MRGADLGASDLATFANRWHAALSTLTPSVPAGGLYGGRAFVMARSAAHAAGATLGVVSAGLGFVAASTAVPSYSLSVAAGDDSLAKLVSDYAPSPWWRSVRAGPFSSDLASSIRASAVTMIALTRPYASLVAESLEDLEDRVGSLRLFGLGLERVLPGTLRRAIMPYGESSEAAIGAGTRGDFCARALAFHLLHAGEASGELDRERGFATSNSGAASRRPVRREATDEQIATLIKGRGGPRAAVSVRLVRNAGFACGSDRFDRILASMEEQA